MLYMSITMGYASPEYKDVKRGRTEPFGRRLTESDYFFLAIPNRP